MNLSLLNVTPVALLSYMQFLVSNNISPSVIEVKLTLYGIPIDMFQDPRIKYFHKVMALSRPFKVSLKRIIDIQTLQLIARTCDSTYMGQVFKAVYMLAFLFFLWLSNLAPHTHTIYSPLSTCILLVVKWSKTLQAKNAVRILKKSILKYEPHLPSESYQLISNYSWKSKFSFVPI